MLESGNYKDGMNKHSHFNENISGTNSNWYQVNTHLKSSIEQNGFPATF